MIPNKINFARVDTKLKEEREKKKEKEKQMLMTNRYES